MAIPNPHSREPNDGDRELAELRARWIDRYGPLVAMQLEPDHRYSLMMVSGAEYAFTDYVRYVRALRRVWISGRSPSRWGPSPASTCSTSLPTCGPSIRIRRTSAGGSGAAAQGSRSPDGCCARAPRSAGCRPAVDQAGRSSTATIATPRPRKPSAVTMIVARPISAAAIATSDIDAWVSASVAATARAEPSRVCRRCVRWSRPPVRIDTPAPRPRDDDEQRVEHRDPRAASRRPAARSSPAARRPGCSSRSRRR